MPVKTLNTGTCYFSLLIIRAAWADVEADRKELGGSEGRGERKGPKNLGREKSGMPVPNQGKEGTAGDAEKVAGLGCMVK